jgi:peroxiredoxin
LDSLSAIGDSAPLFTLPDRYGGLYRLSEMRGKIVLLVFWSPECDWCQRTDNALVAALPDWGARVHVLWIASNHGEPLDRLAQVAEQRGLSLVLLDTGQQVADSYRAQVTPHVFVIDAGGILRYQGAFDDVTFRQRTPTRPYTTQAVEALLQGKQPDPANTPAYGCAIIHQELSTTPQK